jgi:hypothetical protein
MKPIWIITLGLASLLAWPVFGQTPTPKEVTGQKSTRLPTVKVRPPRIVPTHNRAAKGGPGGQGTSRTAGYLENDITAAKFGSKHWWTVQGWQSGGSSGTPR